MHVVVETSLDCKEQQLRIDKITVNVRQMQMSQH